MEQEDATDPQTLWEALPKGALPPALLLWGDQNPLLHLMRRYLLSDRNLRRYSFLQEFQAVSDAKWNFSFLCFVEHIIVTLSSSAPP